MIVTMISIDEFPYIEGAIAEESHGDRFVLYPK
jgi:hypothetical protein